MPEQLENPHTTTDRVVASLQRPLTISCGVRPVIRGELPDFDRPFSTSDQQRPPRPSA